MRNDKISTQGFLAVDPHRAASTPGGGGPIDGPLLAGPKAKVGRVWDEYDAIRSLSSFTAPDLHSAPRPRRTPCRRPTKPPRQQPDKGACYLPRRRFYTGHSNPLLTYNVNCGTCFAMRYSFTMRNIGAGISGPIGTCGGASKGWGKIPSGVDQVKVSVSQRLRSLRHLCSLVLLERSTVERCGDCRWIYGALGSRSRQEGGQYRAGRRAPPPSHRSGSFNSGAGGKQHVYPTKHTSHSLGHVP